MAELAAGEGRRLYGETAPSELPDKLCLTLREPIGVCGLITPWNFPVAIPAWKSFHALICGNTVVLKPASDTPLCGAEFVRAGRRRLAAGGGEPGPRPRLGHRRSHVPERPNPPDLHHRLHRDRTARRGRLRPDGQTGVVGMRREERRNRHGRRRSRSGHRRRALGRLRHLRPAVYRHQPVDRPSGRPRRVARPACRPRRRAAAWAGRRSVNRGGAAGERKPVPKGPRIHPHRPRGGPGHARLRRPVGPRAAGWTRAGSSSPPFSPLWAARCASSAKRSSARCCR